MVIAPEEALYELTDLTTCVSTGPDTSRCDVSARNLTEGQNANIGPQLYPLTDDAFFTFPLPASARQYGTISGTEMKRDLVELVAISLKSRDDGNQFWGRITGTPYDTMSRQWLAARFRKLGLQTREEPLAIPPLWFPKRWK